MFGSWFTREKAEASFANGTAALNRGDDDLALTWFLHAIRLDARFAPAYLGTGLARLRKGEYDAAIADLSEAIRLSNDARGYFLRSLCYRGKGDRTRERRDHREAIRRDPRVAHVLHDPAVAYA